MKSLRRGSMDGLGQDILQRKIEEEQNDRARWIALLRTGLCLARRGDEGSAREDPLHGRALHRHRHPKTGLPGDHRRGPGEPHLQPGHQPAGDAGHRRRAASHGLERLLVVPSRCDQGAALSDRAGRALVESAHRRLWRRPEGAAPAQGDRGCPDQVQDQSVGAAYRALPRLRHHHLDARRCTRQCSRRLPASEREFRHSRAMGERPRAA